MSIDFLDIVLNGAHNTFPLPTLCKRFRLRKSNCRKCMEICPENAIILDPGPTIKGGCSDCGLCQRICPTEAFQNQIYRETVLLNQIKSLPERKSLVIHCRQAEGESNDSISSACLGGVSENLVLGVALLGFDELLLIHGVCAKCRFQKGRKLLEDSIIMSRVLLEGLELGKFRMNLMEQEKGREKILSRREIFSRVSKEIKQKASSTLYHKEETFQKIARGIPGRKDDKRGSPRRRLLQTLIKQQRWDKSVVLKYKPEFPWGRIKIDEKKCSACGTCIALCPTGSISSKLEDGYQFFYFDSSLCTNCSLCKEACPGNAIDFEVDFPLADIFKDNVKIVARVKLTSCVHCGELMVTEGGTLCSTCQKRQMGAIPGNA